MIKKIIKLELFVLGVVFALSFAGTKRPKHQGIWTTCYNTSQNSLHFQEPGVATKECGGSTVFHGPMGQTLIQNVLKNGAFSETRAGTRRSVHLGNGRQILVSQWSRHARSNDIYVLEPHFAKGRVARHCRIENYTDVFNTRYNKKTGILYVQVDWPADKKHTKFKRVWKPCKL